MVGIGEGTWQTRVVGARGKWWVEELRGSWRSQIVSGSGNAVAVAEKKLTMPQLFLLFVTIHGIH